MPLVLLTIILAQIHNFFPKDFTVSPCAPTNNCQTFTDSELPNAAFRFYGLQLDMNWVNAHRDAILKELEPACRRHATCMATPSNLYWFCDDVLALEAKPICDRLSPGDEQCKTFMETHLLGIDMRGKDTWMAAQACAAKLPPATHSKPLELWMVPESLPAGFKGKVVFYVLDPETRVPIHANIKFEDQIVYVPPNPQGLPATMYPIDYSVKYKRVPNADGHTDLVPPMVTVNATGYPEVKFRLAADVPKLKVTMKPAPERLHRGKNLVVIEAHDAKTGKPVEARVMFGEDAVGDTNKTIELDVPRGKRPEIWLTSLFNAYSDVVVAK